MGAIAAATGQAYPAAARTSAPSAPGDASLAGYLRTDLASYLHDHASDEHVSAAALSVSLPGRPSTIDVSAGTTRFGGSRPVTPDSVWQIGSNTKAFTSVLLLKLEAQHKLSIHDTVGRWLPQYPQWRDVTISSLLHMTSGIASYEDQPAFQAAFAAHPYREFSKEQLVSYAIGAPPTSGWSYSNTGYILAEMIIEKAARDSYEHQLYTRIIAPLGLHDLFYRPSFYPPQVTSASGSSSRRPRTPAMSGSTKAAPPPSAPSTCTSRNGDSSWLWASTVTPTPPTTITSATLRGRWS